LRGFTQPITPSLGRQDRKTDKDVAKQPRKNSRTVGSAALADAMVSALAGAGAAETLQLGQKYQSR
jgi:hypothetical protein